MKTLIAGAGVAALFAAGAVQAQPMTMQPEFYFGGQYNYLEQRLSGQSNLNYDVFSGRFGVQVNPFISGETRLGFGVSGDRVDPGNVKTEVHNYYGFYARAGLPNETAFTPYVIGGWTDVRFELDGNGQSRDGGSYGAGVDFNLDPFLALNLEYMRMQDKSDYDLDAFSLGFTFKF